MNIDFCDETNLKYAATVMTQTATKNKKVSQPVKHYLLSWREGEIPTNEQVDEAVMIVLKTLNLEENECLYGLHKNTDNYHVHISVNTVHPITHKCIRPNNNWDIKGMERAARKIEKEQGWQVEINTWTEIDENGFSQEIKSELNKEDKPIKQEKCDKEIRTGEKSAVRLAQEVLLPLMKSATSWQQIHFRLGNKGCEYMPKGSGAIIKIGDTVIKASDVSKFCTMKNMEKKFGPFIPRKETGANVNQELKDEHIDEPIKEAEENDLWREYNDNRLEYAKWKKEAKHDFNLNVKEQRNKLYQKQKQEREQNINCKWKKGWGPIKNMLRSQIAVWQAQEKQELNEDIKDQRKVFNNNFQPFPNFEDWLKNKDLYEDAEVWRYKKEYTYDPDLMSGYPDKFINPAAQDIRSYRGIVDNETGYIDFIDVNRPDRVAFTDRGRSLKIEMTDEKTLLAGLELAQQKWGGVKLTGSQDYINKCIEIAVKHNIRISNPELQDKIKVAKEKEDKLRKEAPIQKQIDGFRRYELALEADKIKVTATQYFEDGGRRGFMVNQKDGFPDGYDPQSLEDHMNRIVNLQRSGRNIYYTPISKDTYHILVDDLSPESLADLTMSGFKPAIILETSPDNFQAIMNVDKPGTEFDREIGNRLTKILNKTYGDPKVSGEIHAHRAPGFDNKKIKHKKEDGSFPEIIILQDKGGKCPQCCELIKTIYTEIVKEKEERPKINITQTSNEDTEGAYTTHLHDIVNIHKRKDIDITTMDASRIDSMIAVRLRATGHPYEKVVDAIEKMAPQTREIIGSKGTHNWQDYAIRTADWAFGIYGDMQLVKFDSQIPKWQKIETFAIQETRRRISFEDNER